MRRETRSDDLPSRHQRLHEPSAIKWIASHAPAGHAIAGDVVLCAVVKAELIFGALRSNLPGQNLAKLDVFFAAFQSLPFDDLAAREYGAMRNSLERAGTPIGPNDLMIASIAVSQRLTLVSHNTREFGRIPGLQIEDWQANPP